MRIGLYPGTFDPITKGHLDIIERACSLVDKHVIGVAINRDKGPLFNLEERVELLRPQVERISAEKSVEIQLHPFENLLVDCAKDVGASTIIRGLRAVSDFEYEYALVGMNRAMDNQIETAFLMADSEYQAVASRLVKEIARLGGPVEAFVPENVVEALRKKFA
jgi:pantetheine-phosphate adenylyltransferase